MSTKKRLNGVIANVINPKSHPGNLSGRRGSGSKERVGATVRRIGLEKEVALCLRVVCLSLYGRADTETVAKHVTNLVFADWQAWDEQTQASAERTLEGEAI